MAAQETESYCRKVTFQTKKSRRYGSSKDFADQVEKAQAKPSNKTMQQPKQFFILAGAPKSGTTALANWLEKWPEIRMSPRKEPKFFTDFSEIPWTGPVGGRFARSIVSDETEYLSSFGDCEAQHWALDASTDYLWCDVSAGKIRDWAERYRVKVACILRDPIARAISEYEHTIRDLLPSDSFYGSLTKEDERFKNNWHPLFYHTRRSRYYDQVNRYRSLFGDDFLLIDYAELKTPDVLGRKLERFLNLPPKVLPQLARENVAVGYRSRFLASTLNNRTIAELARLIAPQPLRRSIWSLTTRLNRTSRKYYPSRKELDFLSSALAEDIQKCRRDPFFPTDSWDH